jgi:hypothetical protein
MNSCGLKQDCFAKVPECLEISFQAKACVIHPCSVLNKKFRNSSRLIQCFFGYYYASTHFLRKWNIWRFRLTTKCTGMCLEPFFILAGIGSVGIKMCSTC